MKRTEGTSGLASVGGSRDAVPRHSGHGSQYGHGARCVINELCTLPVPAHARQSLMQWHMLGDMMHVVREKRRTFFLRSVAMQVIRLRVR